MNGGIELAGNYVGINTFLQIQKWRLTASMYSEFYFGIDTFEFQKIGRKSKIKEDGHMIMIDHDLS